MTIYHVDRYYNKDDTIRYGVMPYNLLGTVRNFLGGHYYPRWRALPDFVRWMASGRFSEDSANKLAAKKNGRRTHDT